VHDASTFTRRDRRGNARKAYYNGGPVPFGYEARTVAQEGKKQRRRLFIAEDEAAMVRLIFDLALHGVDGQRRGTRAIAAHLNANGYSLRGRRFHNSNVDGILTREHYAGSYLDRTADDESVTPSDEDAIVVPCPQIIEPDVMAQVAASRTKAAPRVTPPRITNSPVLLTGVARCNEGECDAGLTIRTGKGGRYAYYTCNAKASAGAERCGVKAIRQEELDRDVLDVLLKRMRAVRPTSTGSVASALQRRDGSGVCMSWSRRDTPAPATRCSRHDWASTARASRSSRRASGACPASSQRASAGSTKRRSSGSGTWCATAS
jgi:hypothetical protein